MQHLFTPLGKARKELYPTVKYIFEHGAAPPSGNLSASSPTSGGSEVEDEEDDDDLGIEWLERAALPHSTSFLKASGGIFPSIPAPIDNVIIARRGNFETGNALFRNEVFQTAPS